MRKPICKPGCIKPGCIKPGAGGGGGGIRPEGAGDIAFGGNRTV